MEALLASRARSFPAAPIYTVMIITDLAGNERTTPSSSLSLSPSPISPCNWEKLIPIDVFGECKKEERAMVCIYASHRVVSNMSDKNDKRACAAGPGELLRASRRAHLRVHLCMCVSRYRGSVTGRFWARSNGRRCGIAARASAPTPLEYIKSNGWWPPRVQTWCHTCVICACESIGRKACFRWTIRSLFMFVCFFLSTGVIVRGWHDFSAPICLNWAMSSSTLVFFLGPVER